MNRCRHAQYGFTLIEVMVVLVILGVMATSLTLGVRRIQAARSDADVERMRQWFEIAAEQALFRGMPLSLQIGNRELLIERSGLDGKPLPTGEGKEGLRHLLPEGWQVVSSRQERDSGIRLLISPDALAFTLRFSTPEGEVRFVGDSQGLVTAQKAERS